MSCAASGVMTSICGLARRCAPARAARRGAARRAAWSRGRAQRKMQPQSGRSGRLEDAAIKRKARALTSVTEPSYSLLKGRGAVYILENILEYKSALGPLYSQRYSRIWQKEKKENRQPKGGIWPKGGKTDNPTHNTDVSTWSTWSAVSNRTSRAGELRSAPSEPDDRDRATG